MKIEKKKKTVTYDKVKELAKYVKQDDGTTVYHGPVIEKKEKQITLYCIDDGVDCHEFASEKDAKAFLRGVK